MTDDTDPATLELLSGFELLVGARQISLISSAQRLLAFFALHDRALDRIYVAEKLWPETTLHKACANLRSSLWRVHQVAGPVIAVSAHQLKLSSHVSVDVREAEARAHRLLDYRRPCDDILTAETLGELSADLLPDWYDDWVLLRREHFHQLRLHALESMCEQLTAATRYGEAVEAGLAAVHAEPLRESAHRSLIEAHLAAGNRWDALRQYGQLRQLLFDELGLEPSGALRSLLSPQSVW